MTHLRGFMHLFHFRNILHWSYHQAILTRIFQPADLLYNFPHLPPVIMASAEALPVLQTPPKTYSCLMYVRASSTPKALAIFKRKLSAVEGEQAIEMSSPLSGKRVRYLNTDSEELSTQFNATRGLLESIDTLRKVKSNFPCVLLFSFNI